ncbi:hypothetical protein PMI29_00202 [Pseudomonas sp. GM49]|nr:hypothetical protein PMI29_00202 [Pseudomonas sp. GM49]
MSNLEGQLPAWDMITPSALVRCHIGYQENLQHSL